MTDSWIPSGVVVGCMPYEITREDKIIIEGRECWGYTETTDKNIQLLTDFPCSEMAWVSYLEELGHAAEEELSMSFVHEDLQRLCQILAAGVVRVVRDSS